MKRIKDYKIGIRIAVMVISAILVVFVLLGFYIYTVQKSSILKDTETRMIEQVNDLGQIILTQLKERQSNLAYSMKIAQEFFYNEGKLSINDNKRITLEATNQFTQDKKTISIQELLLNNKPLLNHGLTDKITRLVNVKSTIFQRFDDGFVRVSSTVVNTDGQKAIGTYIPNNSPVINEILKGNSYNARAFVVNDWYLTSYVPIKINGIIVGMLFIGVPEKNLSEIKHIFNSRKYFDTGYPFLVDKEGTFIIHPTKEGENHKNEEFFQQLLDAKSEYGTTTYYWEGKKKIQYFRYLPENELYVSASLYEEELLGIIKKHKKHIDYCLSY